MHPLFQADQDFVNTVRRLGPFWEVKGDAWSDPHALVLVMEYRYRANAWLSDKVIGPFEVDGIPTPGDLEEVQDMLIADKVQNCKDFLTHHLGVHERSEELKTYFRLWLHHLGVDDEQYGRLSEAIERSKR